MKMDYERHHSTTSIRSVVPIKELFCQYACFVISLEYTRKCASLKDSVVEPILLESGDK